MHLILTGATGLVGSACLHQMLVNDVITTISVLSRRSVPMAEGNPKVNVIIHTDFNQYPGQVLEQLKGATGCVWAQGVSANDVSKEAYEEITYSYPCAAAKAFASLSDSFNFVYVSGEGATTAPGRFTPFFGRIKGHAEAELQAISAEPAYGTMKCYSLRPAAVDPKFHTEIHPWIPKLKPAWKATFLPVLLAILRTEAIEWVRGRCDGSDGIECRYEEVGRYLGFDRYGITFSSCAQATIPLASNQDLHARLARYRSSA